MNTPAALRALAMIAAALLAPHLRADGEPVQLPTAPPPTLVHWSPPLALSNQSADPGVIILHQLTLPGAVWLRPHLQGTTLPPGTTLRITSLADGAEQTFDSAMLDAWQGCSAYFNGDTLLLEVTATIPLPVNAARLQLTAAEVSPPFDPRGGPGEIGICNSDDRQPSDQPWVARLMPAVCSASIICANSTALSAGHCAQANMVLQFRVPATQPNCTLVMPPPEDQFPATLAASQNAGVGADWAVFTTGTNTLGQTAFGRMGTYGLISSTPVPSNSPAIIYGYGLDQTCARNNAQQSSPGVVASISANTLNHNCDIRIGSSGSPILVNGRVVGVATHANVCSNICTSVRASAFATAIAARTCPVGCDTIDFNRDTLLPDTQDIADFISVFAGGPCPTPFCGDIDFNNDNLLPDTADIESLIRVFQGGACS